MRRLVGKINPGKKVIQWQTQAGNITTNLKVNLDFSLPALSVKNVGTWKCHVNESAKGRYEMILGGDLLIELVSNLKKSIASSKHNGGPFIGATAPMVDLGSYVFKDLNTGEIKPEDFFTDAYVKEVYES